MSRIYDDTICKLGEGPLWHPRRKQFYWFDIIGHRLLTREDGKTRIVQFDEHVSAAGWVSEDDLLIASETTGAPTPGVGSGLARWAKVPNPARARSIAFTGAR